MRPSRNAGGHKTSRLPAGLIRQILKATRRCPLKSDSLWGRPQSFRLRAAIAGIVRCGLPGPICAVWAVGVIRKITRHQRAVCGGVRPAPERRCNCLRSDRLRPQMAGSTAAIEVSDGRSVIDMSIQHAPPATLQCDVERRRQGRTPAHYSMIGIAAGARWLSSSAPCSVTTRFSSCTITRRSPTAVS